MAPKSKNQIKNTSKRVKHDPQVVESAVQAVRSGKLKLRQAARQYGIAPSTLSDKVKGKTPLEYKAAKLLKDEEEGLLVNYIKTMSERAFGLTTDDIRCRVKAILEIRGGSTKSSDNMPSPAWVHRFFERHPELSLRTPSSLGRERAMVSPTAIKNWFNGLEAHLLHQNSSWDEQQPVS